MGNPITQKNVPLGRRELDIINSIVKKNNYQQNILTERNRKCKKIMQN
jgi:hypothetical protein